MKNFNSFFNQLTAMPKRLAMVLTVLFTLGVGSMWGETETYEKVTSAPSDWSGEYLIVYEDGKVAFNGSLTTLDAASNTTAVTISNNKISLDSKYSFTIAKSGSNYTVKSKSGYYVGQTSDANGLKSSSSTSYSNTISINNDGSVNLVSGGAYLRYNATSSISNGSQTGLRFRYYKSSSYTNQKAILLYKKVEAAKTTTIIIDPNTSNHGTGSEVQVTVTCGQSLPSFTACTPATGYELVGYYTSATGGTKLIAKDGKLTASVAGYTDASAKWVNESTTVTLYAQYSAINYTVTYKGNNGTTSCAGGTYTYNSSFDICSDEPTRTGYTFTGWSDGTNTYRPGDSYIMPAENVTFTAQWTINTYTVTWIVDRVTKRTDTGVAYNTSKTAPTVSPIPCGDVIAGWTDAENGNYVHGTSTLHSGATPSITITSDKTFYAVFADYED